MFDSLGIERNPETGWKWGPTRQELTLKILRSIKKTLRLSDKDRAQKYKRLVLKFEEYAIKLAGSRIMP